MILPRWRVVIKGKWDYVCEMWYSSSMKDGNCYYYCYYFWYWLRISALDVCGTSHRMMLLGAHPRHTSLMWPLDHVVAALMACPCCLTGLEGGEWEASGSSDSRQGWLDQEEQWGPPGALERPLPAPLPGPAVGLRERGEALFGSDIGDSWVGGKVRAAQASS